MRILIGFGTRPEAIKLVPVIYALRDKCDLTVVSSGQHAELLKQVLDFFDVRPDHSFCCMREKPDLVTLNADIMRETAAVFRKERPDAIIVQGDTMTAYSIAFNGFLNKIPVFHVEAGLRTYNNFSPFPEEMLRSLISRAAEFHFAPTASARDNLIAEGIAKNRIWVTGNTVVDALLIAAGLVREADVDRELSAFQAGVPSLLKSRKCVLVTAHRRENIGGPMADICRAVRSLATDCPDAVFVWPLHMNPDVRQVILKEMRGKPSNIVLTEGLSYQTLVYLLKVSFLVMTDSGGIQEEAPTFGKPVIVLRDTTERPEVVSSGIGFLTGTNRAKIERTFLRLYRNTDFYRSVSRKKNPFGDGKAADKIAGIMLSKKMRAFIENYPQSAIKKVRREM